MTTSNHEAPTLPEGTPSSQESKTTKKATTPASKAGRRQRKAQAARKSPRASKKAKRTKQPKEARRGTKTAKVLTLLQRPNGASLPELIRATGWQPHSVRGFLSGTVGKNLGLSVASIKDPKGTRRYSLQS